MDKKEQILLARKIAKKIYSPEPIYQSGYKINIKLGRNNPANFHQLRYSVRINGNNGLRVLL